MKITYANEKEKEYYENGGFDECLQKKNGNDLRIVCQGGEYWIGFTVKDEGRANTFVYELLAAMNNNGREDTIDTDFIGIDVTEIGTSKHESRDFSDKITECINILSSLV